MSKISRIKNGELFLVSTDTVPGIGGIVTELTKEKLMTIKKVREEKKFAILVANIFQAREFSEWNKDADALAKEYWPQPLTIALDTYAIRMPNSRKLLKLLKKIGPIYLTSANIHNEKPLNFNDAKIKFKNDIKIHLNYTKNSSGLSSTVVKSTTRKIIRQGEVRIK